MKKPVTKSVKIDGFDESCDSVPKDVADKQDAYLEKIANESFQTPAALPVVTQEAEIIKSLYDALRSIIRQIPNDENLADWYFDLAEAAEEKAISYLKSKNIDISFNYSPAQVIPVVSGGEVDKLWNDHKKNRVLGGVIADVIFYSDFKHIIALLSQFTTPAVQDTGKWISVEQQKILDAVDKIRHQSGAYIWAYPITYRDANNKVEKITFGWELEWPDGNTASWRTESNDYFEALNEGIKAYQ